MYQNKQVSDSSTCVSVNDDSIKAVATTTTVGSMSPSASVITTTNVQGSTEEYDVKDSYASTKVLTDFKNGPSASKQGKITPPRKTYTWKSSDVSMPNNLSGAKEDICDDEFFDWEDQYYDQACSFANGKLRKKKQNKKKTMTEVTQFLKKTCINQSSQDSIEMPKILYKKTVNTSMNSFQETHRYHFPRKPLAKRTLKKQANKVHNNYINEKSRKKNIDKKLSKLGLQRIPPCYDNHCNLHFHSKYDKRLCNKSMKYTLNKNNQKNLKISGDSSMEFLIDLQYRDVTPEDYELLLLLDESVQPKVSNKCLVNELPKIIKTEMRDDNVCVVCMETIFIGETIVSLPKCQHEFHKDCIDKWLINFSNKCPIDNIEII